jgi:hypothetical protein
LSKYNSAFEKQFLKLNSLTLPFLNEIEENIGFGFARVYPDQRCARCVTVASDAKNASRHGHNRTATLATPLIIVPALYQNNMVSLHFPKDQEF